MSVSAALVRHLGRGRANGAPTIHLVPVLLGEGRRLFEHLGADHIELKPIRRTGS
jgi:hypothetical protein